MMTKKMLTGIAVVALVGTLSAAAFAAPAAGRGRGAGMRTGMGAGVNYVDNNGDGVCDYYGTGAGSRFASTTFKSTSGTAFCLTTKHLAVSPI